MDRRYGRGRGRGRRSGRGSGRGRGRQRPRPKTAPKRLKVYYKSMHSLAFRIKLLEDQHINTLQYLKGQLQHDRFDTDFQTEIEKTKSTVAEIEREIAEKEIELAKRKENYQRQKEELIRNIVKVEEKRERQIIHRFRQKEEQERAKERKKTKKKRKPRRGRKGLIETEAVTGMELEGQRYCLHKISRRFSHLIDLETFLGAFDRILEETQLDSTCSLLFQCPCYLHKRTPAGGIIDDDELDLEKRCQVEINLDTFLKKLPKDATEGLQVRIHHRKLRLIRKREMLHVHGAVDCTNTACLHEGVHGIAVPILRELRRDPVYHRDSIRHARMCRDCGVTFCSRCGCRYHLETLSDEEKRLCHDGFTCEMMEEIKVGKDPTLAVIHHTSKPCPVCARPITKTEGCDHIHCTVCDGHFCWVCLHHADTGREIYSHLNNVHGAIRN